MTRPWSVLRQSLVWLHLVSILLLAGCAARPGAGSASQPANPPDWLAWQAKRREAVAGTNGWATVIGLHWLREGDNFAGSGPTNHVVLPRGHAPRAVGRFIKQGNLVHFEAAPGVVVTSAGAPARSIDLKSDEIGLPTKLQVGELTITLILRGGRMALRVRDPGSPARAAFRGLKYFPYDPAWRIEGRFEPTSPGETLRVLDITGGVETMPSPGTVVFQTPTGEHRLRVVEERDEVRYFVIFRDRTAGQTTYPSGRFLYVDRPDANGKVVIDFNQSYNPPCAFTHFATCPLPPRMNWLAFPIPAGELVPPGRH